MCIVQVATLRKSLTAGVAVERLLSEVNAFMNFQLAALCKSLSAGLAEERFLSGVDAFMALQGATP